MARKPPAKDKAEEAPPELVTTREEAKRKIEERIEKGHQLQSYAISSERQYEQFKSDEERWGKYNTELLTRLFSNKIIANEYNEFNGGSFPMNAGWQWWANHLKEEIADRINRLQAILERLELFPQRVSTTAPQSKHESSSTGSRKIFVVHGRNSEAKQTIARYLEKLELEPIILHEQASGGRTIIEKFEAYADVPFAVVLLTPDDQGGVKGELDKLQDRARQNVILELGFFIGRLGRHRVCPIYWEGVEIPSDYDGVVYVPFDKAEGWKLTLARELRASGIAIDSSKLL